jgi:hypothetical protein
MNLSAYSKKYIENNLIDYFDKCDFTKRDKYTTHMYKSLFKEIQIAYTNIPFVSGLLENNKVITRPKLLSEYFITKEIKSFIENGGKHQIKFTHTIMNREITIYFMLFSEDELAHLEKYQKYAEYMFMWLSICIKYSSKSCAQTLKIYVYHTPFEKTLPNKRTIIIGTENVNSAYSNVCSLNGEIVIFRKEEWFKVFIHETMHAYGFDFSSYPTEALNNIVQFAFPLDIEFKVSEAYAETWARIINCAFTSFMSLKSKENSSMSDFLLYMDFSLQIEKYFSLQQSIKILDFMGLTYEDLYSGNEKSVILRSTMYRENSNIFSYYILTSLFLNDFQGFMTWCKYNTVYNAEHRKIKYNCYCIQFNPSSLREFGDYIADIYDSQDYLHNLSCIKKYMKHKTGKISSRMSIIEFV